ncbi:MAG TPA: metallophosphoesterase [Candidatus Moranbacteria bacterium]|nr:metallophosphoesterase [Candidatus Moranbacteria bacterium]
MEEDRIIAMRYSFILLALFFLFILSFSYSQAFNLGIVADIHAGGSRDITRSEKNILYPNRYCINLEGIKKSDVDYILTLGDNTLNGKESEAKKVLNCLKGYDVLWTKGNHDKEVAWQLFGTPNYYSRQIENWKIIVLDSSKIDPSGSGGFLDEQLEWLEKELSENDSNDIENIFIATHHNIFEKTDLFPNTSNAKIIFPQFFKPIQLELPDPVYEKFIEIIESNGKVRYVYSGHVHLKNGCLKSGNIEYCSVPSASVMNYEGYFKELSLE